MKLQRGQICHKEPWGADIDSEGFIVEAPVVVQSQVGSKREEHCNLFCRRQTLTLFDYFLLKKKYVRTPWLWSVRVWPRWGPLQDWSSSEETTSRRKWQIKEKIMTSFLLQCPTSAARQFRLQRQQMFKKVTDTEFENIQVLFFICYVSIVNRKSVKHFFSKITWHFRCKVSKKYI